MIAILDVSAAMEILLLKDKKALFDDAYKKASWVIAPDVYVSEISNVLWKYKKAGVIDYEDCIQFCEDGIDLIDDFIAADTLWKEALGEGIKNNHSIYDMFYAVLTRRNDAVLITNDEALAKVCKALNIECVF
jgi:predicted nucleic acid-binding protein